MERIAREEVPFVGQLGIRFEHIEDGTARAVLPMTAETVQLRPGGTISGPVMMGMADYVMYACVISMVGPALMAVTTISTPISCAGRDRSTWWPRGGCSNAANAWPMAR